MNKINSRIGNITKYFGMKYVILMRVIKPVIRVFMSYYKSYYAVCIKRTVSSDAGNLKLVARFEAFRRF